jgi:heme oxygenase (mycobilin-producing)
VKRLPAPLSNNEHPARWAWRYSESAVIAMKTDAQACPATTARPTPPSEDAPERPALGFVALSKFVVANGMTPSVKASFRNRPHMVDAAPGYLRMDVISPVDRPDEIWLMTFWTNEASFRAWHHSHLYHASHKGIPEGLKLVPGETQIRVFEHVAS